MPFEIKVSVNVFSPATTQVLIGPPPSTFNNCYQCLNLVIFAVQLYLIWLSVPRATSNTPTAGEAVFISSTQNLAARGPNALACQCCAPQSEPPTQVVVQEAADATVGQETPSQRPSTKDRGPVAQAPEPPKQIETQTGADQPSSSASVTHCRSPRGSNQLVVRPPDSPSLLPPGTGIPEKPSSACPLSPVHPNVENASTPEQNDDGPTSNYLFQPSPTGTQDPVVENSHNSPLNRTLVGLPLDAPFVVLGVGVSNEGLPGPRHDIELIGKHLPRGSFRTLIDTDATQETIHRAVQETLGSVRPHTLVILYLTGHSDDHNAFKLSDGRSIDVDTLLEWIDQIRIETGKFLPVLLVFDHCRETHDLPRDMSAAKLKHIYIIWACSPQQQAYEINLNNDLPYSEFLKSACLTLRELLVKQPRSPSYFLERAGHWMSVAVRVHRGFICERAKCPTPWLTCCCPICYMGKLCEHPAHEADRDQRPIQTPTGWFHEAKSDVEISTIMPILEPIAGAIMKIGGAILNSPPYQKHSAEEQPCSNNNGRQTAGPSTRRGVTTAPASALAPALPQPCRGPKDVIFNY